MVRHLNPHLLERIENGVKLDSAPFYVIRAPLTVRVIEETKTKHRLVLKLVDKITSVLFSITHFKRDVDMVHPLMEDEAFVRKVKDMVIDMVERYDSALVNKPLFISVDLVDAESIKKIELLRRVRRPGNFLPIFIAVPLHLDPDDNELLNAVKVLEENFKVALLLGIEQRPVTVVNVSWNRSAKYSVAEYLIRKPLERVLSKYSEHLGTEAGFVASGLIRRLIEYEVSKVYEDSSSRVVDKFANMYPRLSVNTVFLDAVLRVVADDIGDIIANERWHATSDLADDIFMRATDYFEKGTNMLVEYVERLGAPAEIVEAIRRGEALFDQSGRPLTELVKRVKMVEEDVETVYS